MAESARWLGGGLNIRHEPKRDESGAAAQLLARADVPFSDAVTSVLAAEDDRAVAEPNFDLLTLDALYGRAPILFVAIKPSRLRFAAWPTMDEANRAIAAKCEADPSLHYVDIASPMLAAADAGQPPPGRLFMLDGLHLSAEGYALWTELVRGSIEGALGASAPR